MATDTATIARTHTSATHTTLALILAGAAAIGLNAAVAAIAVALGAPAPYPPLTLPIFGAFTAIGIVIGWFGWLMITRRAARPRELLTWLVPTVFVVSFVPDVALLILKFIPGTNTAAALALMAMHAVVFAVAIPVYAWLTRNGSREI